MFYFLFRSSRSWIACFPCFSSEQCHRLLVCSHLTFSSYLELFLCLVLTGKAFWWFLCPVNLVVYKVGVFRCLLVIKIGACFFVFFKHRCISVWRTTRQAYNGDHQQKKKVICEKKKKNVWDGRIFLSRSANFILRIGVAVGRLLKMAKTRFKSSHFMCPTHISKKCHKK